MANRRLFSVVREERQLTYDANFHLQDFDAVQGGWYLVSVTSSPSQVLAALQACQEALISLTTDMSVEAMQSAKRTIINRFKVESQTNKFWVEKLSGTQLTYSPYKNIRSLADFESVLQSVTQKDLLDLVKVFQFREDCMSLCVGVTAPELPADLKEHFKFN